VAFTSYATPTIMGELKRHARDSGWGVHVPRQLQERVLKVEGATEAFTADHGRSPSPGQLSEATGLTTEDVLETLEAASSHRPESLDVPLGTADGLTRAETIGALDPRYEQAEDAFSVAPALRELPERERRMLSMRFGEELPQSEIARRLGISQMHVSRLLRRTLDDLSRKVEAPALTG